MSRNIWVTSDTHFGHSNIIKYCDRPFRDTDEMDNHIVEKWNNVVQDGDIVYHLGDVYFGGNKGAEYWDWFFPRLKGRKRLLLGNHDNGKDQRLLQTFGKIELWRMFPEFGLLLTHVPVHPSTLRESPKRPNGLINVHGHTHDNGEPDNSGNYKCVCVELTDYTPVNIEELRNKKEKKTNYTSNR